MFVNISYNTTRPNRLTEAKNRDYHLRYARWALSAINHPLHKRFIGKTIINWRFYKNQQWIFNEDTVHFFMDESGDSKNRIKIGKNIVRPIVLQYEGNAIRMNYTARAQCVSETVINRRESELSKLKLMSAAAKISPVAKEVFTSKGIPLGNTESEVEEIFENLFIDHNTKNINNLIKYLEDKIDVEETKKGLARQLALSGLCIFKYSEWNGEYVGDTLDPMFYFHDKSARKPDLSDSEYMGDWSLMDVASICEKYQDMSTEERMAIERYASSQTAGIHKLIYDYYGVTSGKIPVFEVYWKDMQREEYAWVRDPYGYPLFTRINSPDNEYTDKDIIKAPTPRQQERMKGKKKVKIYVDILRYCIFIPREEVSSSKLDSDIVLEYGTYPWAEKTGIDPHNVKYPYKCYTWAYDKGEIMSPIDDVIDPQRFINRLLSVSESIINNSGGSNTVIAEEAISSRDGEGAMKRDIKQGKPIVVKITKAGSIQNAVGRYDNTIPPSIGSYFNIMQQVGQMVSDITGVNEAMTGTMGGQQRLVGVVQQQIERGTLTQEPFYFAITRVLKQVYDSFVTVGKRIYIENPRRLSIVVGDQGVQEIVLTQDMKAEDFRTFIHRTVSQEDQVNAGNNLIMTLLQMGMLDPMTASNLFGRANADEVAEALRNYQGALAQAKKLQDQQNQQIMQAQAQAQQQQGAAMENIADRQNLQTQIQDKEDKAHELEKIATRGMMQIERDKQRALNK